MLSKLWRKMILLFFVPIIAIIAFGTVYSVVYFSSYRNSRMDEISKRISAVVDTNAEYHENRLIAFSEEDALYEYFWADETIKQTSTFISGFHSYTVGIITEFLNNRNLPISSVRILYNTDTVSGLMPTNESYYNYDSAFMDVYDGLYEFKMSADRSKWITIGEGSGETYVYLVKCQKYGDYLATLALSVNRSAMNRSIDSLLVDESVRLDNGEKPSVFESVYDYRYEKLGYTTKLILRDRTAVVIIFSAVLLFLITLAAMIIFLLFCRDVKDVFAEVENMSKTAMESVQSDEGEAEITENRSDIAELKRIRNNFRVIISRARRYAEQKAATETAQKQAQLVSLERQLNPHFMYNVIESFRMRLFLAGEKEISDAMYDFGKMIRYNLTDGYTEVTLASEIHYAERYVRLCAFRFDRIIPLDITLPEQAYDYVICRFVLQPIVENSIRYNEKPHSGFRIDIEGKDLDDGRFLLSVRDNGLGTSAETMSDLNEKLKENVLVEQGVSLINVNSRLRLIYGEDCGVEIDSVEGEYFETKLYMRVKR